MLKLWFVRHGMTEGNSHQRYIGVTDEPLCEEGRKLLEKFTYPAVQALFVSPLKRCRETASILFPKGEQRIVPLLAECDFGEFENKNYKELSDNPHYQEWIDSNGTLPFPGGESKEECADRNLKGFDEVLKACRDDPNRESLRFLPIALHLLSNHSWLSCFNGVHGSVSFLAVF